MKPTTIYHEINNVVNNHKLRDEEPVGFFSVCIAKSTKDGKMLNTTTLIVDDAYKQKAVTGRVHDNLRNKLEALYTALQEIYFND